MLALHLQRPAWGGEVWKEESCMSAVFRFPSTGVGGALACGWWGGVLIAYRSTGKENSCALFVNL